MQKLSIDIHEDFNYQFFQKYDTLTKKQKTIWALAIWWVKRYPNAHPNQTTIAKKAGCKREHVNRTLAKFRKWGWLALLWRGRRMSKTLSISKILQQIDVVKREYFARVEITSKRTHSYSSYKKRTSRAGEFKKEPLVIPKLAQKLGYSESSGRKLALVPEYILQETFYQCQKMGKRGFRPESEERYFVETALKMAIDKGNKIEWRKFYG